jgi:hypothetical protein
VILSHFQLFTPIFSLPRILFLLAYYPNSSQLTKKIPSFRYILYNTSFSQEAFPFSTMTPILDCVKHFPEL